MLTMHTTLQAVFGFDMFFMGINAGFAIVNVIEEHYRHALFNAFCVLCSVIALLLIIINGLLA